MKKSIGKIGILFLAGIMFSLSGCGKNEHGILGIEVPVGEGKVTDTTPYMVTGVYLDTPAYRQGVRPDDIIVQINDTAIEKGMKYDFIYNNLLLGKPGEKVTLTVKRKDKLIIFEIIRSGR